MKQYSFSNTYIQKKPIKFNKKIILYEICLNQDESNLFCVSQNKIICIDIRDNEYKSTTIQMKCLVSKILIHQSYLLIVEEYSKLKLFEIQQDFTTIKTMEYKSQINPLTIPAFHQNQNLLGFCYKNKFFVHNFINNTIYNQLRCQTQPKMILFFKDDFLLGIEQNIMQTCNFYSQKTNKIYKSIRIAYSIMNRCQILSQILFLSNSTQFKVFNIQTGKLLFRKSYQQQQISQYLGQQLMKIYSLNEFSLEITSFTNRKLKRVIFLKNPKSFKVSQNEKYIYVMKKKSIKIWEQSE